MASCREALEQTRRAAFGHGATMFGDSELTPAFWESLEADPQAYARREGITYARPLRSQLRALLIDRLQAPDLPPLPPPSAVHPVVGVNGSGKTTSAAKLAACWARGCWQGQNPSASEPDRSSSCAQPGSAFRSSRRPREATRAPLCSALPRPPSPPFAAAPFVDALLA